MSSSSSFPSLFFFFFFFLLLLLLLDLLVLLHLGLPLPLLLCLLFFFDLQPSKRASDTTLEKLSTNGLSLSLSRCVVSAMILSDVELTAVLVGGCAQSLC